MSHSDLEWVRKNYPTLQKRYPDMFIAVSHEYVIASSKDYGKVRLVAKGKTKDFAIDFIESGDLLVL